MPNEEFDIMKPISADLDIGTTMFDKPKDSASSKTLNDIFSGGVSTDLDIGTTMFDSPLSEPTELTLQQDTVPAAPIVEVPDKAAVEWHDTKAEQKPSDILPSLEENDIFSGSVGTDLDIGTTMFDSPLSEPAESSFLQMDHVPVATVAVSDKVKVEQDQATTSQDLPVIAPPDAAERSSTAVRGRVDLDYGFVTAEEAAMFADNADDIQNPQPVASERPTPATDASAVKPPDEVADSSNALERALEELQEVQDEMTSPLQINTTTSEQLMQMALEAEFLEEQKLAEEEWFPNSTVRVMGKVVRGKSKNIATLVMLVIFLAVFLLVPIIVFLTNSAV